MKAAPILLIFLLTGCTSGFDSKGQIQEVPHLSPSPVTDLAEKLNFEILACAEDEAKLIIENQNEVNVEVMVTMAWKAYAGSIEGLNYKSVIISANSISFPSIAKPEMTRKADKCEIIETEIIEK